MLCLWIVACVRGVLSHSAGAHRSRGVRGPRPPASSPSASALILGQFGTRIKMSVRGRSVEESVEVSGIGSGSPDSSGSGPPFAPAQGRAALGPFSLSSCSAVNRPRMYY